MALPPTALDRRRFGLIDERPLTGPRRPLAANPVTWLASRYREESTWRAVLYAALLVAAELFIGDPAVGKHVGNILAKLGLPPTDDTNRRVMAVLTYLRAR